MKNRIDLACNRRAFLRRAALASVLPLTFPLATRLFAVPAKSNATVAVVKCLEYGPAVRPALNQCLDLLGGIGALVKDKTVTVKVNLTGTNFADFLGRPIGETVMTHYDTAAALAAALIDAGARRVRFVESTNSKSTLETSMSFADWDINALRALGKVEFVNTRNAGTAGKYARFEVPGGGYLFSHFEFNQAYADTDVFVSLAKLKQHVTAGVTMSVKNLFGITPNALYGSEAGREDATAGREPLHQPKRFPKLGLPGAKKLDPSNEPEHNVPNTVADVVAARPVHLAIIDGITSMSGGEGWWCRESEDLRLVKPGLLIAGLNPVSTDAVGAYLMGYDNPRAPRGEGAFAFCDNHLLLAEKAGVGTADVSQIDVRGLALADARRPYAPLRAAQRAAKKTNS